MKCDKTILNSRDYILNGQLWYGITTETDYRSTDRDFRRYNGIQIRRFGKVCNFRIYFFVPKVFCTNRPCTSCNALENALHVDIGKHMT